MKNIITVTLVSLVVLLGYATLKSWFDGETKATREEQFMPPPPREAVPQNADGTWDFSGLQYQKSTTNWPGMALVAGFVISMCLLIHHLFRSIERGPSRTAPRNLAPKTAPGFPSVCRK